MRPIKNSTRFSRWIKPALLIYFLFFSVKLSVACQIPGFTYAASGTCGNVFNFTNITPDIACSSQWLWDFGDGTVEVYDKGDPNANNITHMYCVAGTYTVTLMGLPDLRKNTQTITVSTVSSDVNFTYTPATPGCAPQTINFTGIKTCINAPTVFHSWSFGDGTTASVQNPSHTYSQPGTYNVTFSVFTSKKCFFTETKSITIQGGSSDFNVVSMPDACNDVLNTCFDAVETNVAATHSWAFQNGSYQTTASGKSPCVFLPNGVTIVTHNTILNNCVTTTTKTVTISTGYDRVNPNTTLHPQTGQIQVWTVANNPLGTTPIIRIKGTLTIKSGYRILMKGMTIQFDPTGRLIVERGAQLTLSGTTLDGMLTCPSRTWNGVQVWGTKTSDQSLTLGGSTGRLVVQLNSTIKNASTGVLLGNSNNDIAYNGGYLIASNSNFINNVIGVDIKPYHRTASANNRTTITACKFIMNSSTTDPLYNGPAMNTFIRMEDVNGIGILGNTFNNAGFLGYDVTARGTGIRAIGATARIGLPVPLEADEPNLPLPVRGPNVNKFLNLFQGIHASDFAGSTLSTGNFLMIINNDLFNNATAVFLENSRYDEVILNRILHPNSVGSLVRSYGVKASGSKDFLVSNNLIQGVNVIPGTNIAPGVGFDCNNSDGGSQGGIVQFNYFRDLVWGCHTTGANSTLSMECGNEYNNMEQHAWFIESGSLKNQGTGCVFFGMETQAYNFFYDGCLPINNPERHIKSNVSFDYYAPGLAPTLVNANPNYPSCVSVGASSVVVNPCALAVNPASCVNQLCASQLCDLLPILQLTPRLKQDHSQFIREEIRSGRMAEAEELLRQQGNSLLLENIPNPASTKTSVTAYIPIGSSGNLVLCDLTGRIVGVYPLVAGLSETEVALSTLTECVYLYSLEVNGRTTETKKLIVLK